MTMQPPDPAAVNPPDPTATGAGASGNLPDDPLKKALADLTKAQAEATEWKNRFGGLQGKYQQEQSKWAESAAKMLEFDEQNKKLSGELEALKVTSTKTFEEKDTLATDLDVKTAELDRLTIILREFPHLAPLLGSKDEEDALPDGTGDELRQKLTNLSGKIDLIKKGEREEHKSGGSPSNPPASLKGNEGLLKQAIDAMRAGKLEEYNNLYAQYLEQTKSPGG